MSSQRSVMTCCAVGVLAVAVVLTLPSSVFAVAYTWSGGGGPGNTNFNNAANWGGAGWPNLVGDTASFTALGMWNVAFNVSPTNADMRVTQGGVTMATAVAFPAQTWTLTNMGNMFAGGNVSGGALTLGAAGTNRLTITGPNSWRQSGNSTVSLTNNSRLWPSSLILGYGSPGTTDLTVDGVQANVTANTGLSTLGQDGATGNLTLKNTASGSLGDLIIGAGAANNSSGSVSVESGANLSTLSISAGTSGGAGQVATITVGGGGASISQWLGGMNTLTLGFPTANSSGTLNVNTGGTFTTGTGLTQVNNTGLINVNGGAFNLSGDLTVDGSTAKLQTLGAGSFFWNGNRTMNIKNGGTVDLASSLVLPTNAIVNIQNANSKLLTSGSLVVANGSRLNLTPGGSVTTGSDLNVGTGGTNGWLDADGAMTNVTVHSVSECWWGGNGGTGSVTFSNGATGSVDRPVSVGYGATGTGTLDVQTGATLSLPYLNVAYQDGTATGTVNVSGAGSAITQIGVSTLRLGAASNAGGAVYVWSGGTFTTGTGLMTINPTGLMSVGATGTLHAKGNIQISGGVLATDLNGTLDWTGTNLTVNSGGRLTDNRTSTWALPNGAQVQVNGASSRLEKTAGTIEFDGGAQATIDTGGKLAASRLNVGVTSSLLTSSVTVDGSSSSLVLTGAEHYLGLNGGIGSLTFRNGTLATLNDISGTLRLAYSVVANSTGNLTAQTGGQATIGNLFAGTEGVSGQGATITVTGAGSAITQSDASTLFLGAAANSTALLSVTSSGTFTTGTGLTTVNKTGTITVDGGTFNANGNITLDGGVLDTTPLGMFTFTWAASKTMNIQSGGRFTYRGTNYSLPASATVNVSGTGSSGPSLLEATTGAFHVRSGSQLNVTGGGRVSAADAVYLGNYDPGTLVVDGAGSQLTCQISGDVAGWGGYGGNASATFRNSATGSFPNGGIALAGTGQANSTGTINVESGAGLSAALFRLNADGAASSSSAVATVTGTGSQITATIQSMIGSNNSGSASLYVLNGGQYTSAETVLRRTGVISINGGTANLGTLIRLSGEGTVGLVRGSLTYTGTLGIGLGGLFGDNDVTLNSGQSVTLSGATTINPFWKLTLAGGTLNTASLTNNGAVSFTAGTLGITGAGGLTIGASGPLGSVFTLGSGCNLNVTNATTVANGSALSINGGQWSSGSFDNSGSLMFQSGGLSVSGALTNQATGWLTIGPLGSLETPGTVSNSGTVELLGGSARLGGAGALTNNGVLLGAGRVTKNTTNSATGQIRADSGNHLVFTGASGANAGLITLAGGDLEFTQPLTNSSSGVITGRGQFRVGGTGPAAGLTNNGNIAFSAGISDVYAKLTNNSGSPTPKIITSGGGTTNFWDDVVNNGEIRTSAGCRSTFFGSTSGSGTYTGTGIVDFEGDLRPGSSPAAITIGGDAVFGGSARLEIELGGNTPGSQYDKVQVANNVSLNGRLDVKLINAPYRPSHNDQFEVLTFASRTGDFASKTGLDLGSRLTLIPQYTPSSLVLTAAQGGSGSWRFDLSGNASISTNWTTAIPNGTGDVATLGPVITTAHSVAVDAPTTLGGVVFNNTHRYTLTGPQPVTLDNGLAAASIRVDAAGPEGHLISAPLNLVSELVLQANTGDLTLSGPINDPLGKKITKLGPGTVVFSGTQNYATGTVLQFGSGGGSAPSNSPSPVPEPATIMLLAAGALAWLIASSARRRTG